MTFKSRNVDRLTFHQAIASSQKPNTINLADQTVPAHFLNITNRRVSDRIALGMLDNGPGKGMTAGRLHGGRVLEQLSVTNSINALQISHRKRAFGQSSGFIEQDHLQARDVFQNRSLFEKNPG